MSPQCHLAIPLATMDLSSGSLVKDLACRRYAADEMTIPFGATHPDAGGSSNGALEAAASGF
jgi:hypothetical protein